MDYLQYHKNIQKLKEAVDEVLNLIINGLPSIFNLIHMYYRNKAVLNLIINGLPSIF